MKKIICFLMLSLLCVPLAIRAQENAPTRVLVLTERGGQHESFVAAALEWLKGFGDEHGFSFTEYNHADALGADTLSQYQVFLQLNFPPYTWSPESEAAFIKAIEKGSIGWVGFHHATLLGEFDGYPMWNWFSDFMGGIRFKNYIAAKASGQVSIEAPDHPVMQGVSPSFLCPPDEWYTFDKNPRPNVHVLATVDESTYTPDTDIKMGDHPVVWSNEKVKARNVYFLMGHSEALFTSADFKKMFANALFWAAGQEVE